MNHGLASQTATLSKEDSMNKYWIKGAAIGLLLGFILVIFSHIGWWVFPLAVFVLCLDWSGQGDGREGCNLHTVCNH